MGTKYTTNQIIDFLRGLSAVEFETLEILLDEDASKTIAQSISELKNEQRIPIKEDGKWVRSELKF